MWGLLAAGDAIREKMHESLKLEGAEQGQSRIDARRLRQLPRFGGVAFGSLHLVAPVARRRERRDPCLEGVGR